MNYEYPGQLQLQIPQFIYNTNPTVVPGGGAEVIPLNNPSWFIDNGFTPSFTSKNSFFHSQTSSDEQLGEEPSSSSSSPPSSSVPFQYDLPLPQSFSAAPRPRPLPPPDFSHLLKQQVPPIAPSPFGLPVYSASGFDLLSILSRVATRPFPKVILGPVDLTCSFVVVDVRRYDSPVVYCSPTFCTLTGYSEAEVIGRNCRFLQSPDGKMAKGDQRTHTSPDAVAHLRKSLVSDKECQTSIVNYRKDGSAFINLVTVIPLPGGVSGAPHEENDYVYQVGFQVDLTQQPNAILEKLRDGSYVVNYGVGLPHQPQPQPPAPVTSARDRKSVPTPPVVMSKELKRLIASPAFLSSIPISTSTTVPLPPPSSAAAAALAAQDDSPAGGANHLLHMLLLEATPDFIHVVSLKGNFLYVAPSVRRVLGYEPEEMVGRSVADYAHPEDVIPLMRELKESSATGPSSNEKDSAANAQGLPRSVDLLFRAKTKMGRYVWVECRGRLHVEPGKGRKAIVLSGRAREMANLKWEDVKRAGGLARGIRVPLGGQDKTNGIASYQFMEQEVWGMLAGDGMETMAFMSAGKGAEDVLGWTSEDLIGRGVADIIVDKDVANVLGGIIANMRAIQQQRRSSTQTQSVDGAKVQKIRCSLMKKDGGVADVWFIIYRADPDDEEDTGQPSSPKPINATRGASLSISPAALIYQIRLVDADTLPIDSVSVEVAMASASTSPFSSLAGAVQSPSDNVSLAQPRSPTSLPHSSDPLPPSVDMFEELAISRGSSWQYELQQLRFANLRLRDELAVLEAAGIEEADQSKNDSTVQSQPSSEAQDFSSTIYGYEPLGTYADQYQQLFHEQQYAPQPSSEFRHQQPPYSVQPMTDVRDSSQLQSQTLPQPRLGMTTRRLQRPIHPRPPQISQDWATMASTPTSSDFTLKQATPSSLKRPWNADNA